MSSYASDYRITAVSIQKGVCLLLTDLLKEQHELSQKDDGADQAAGLAVQHVRDQLLPPSKRSAENAVFSLS